MRLTGQESSEIFPADAERRLSVLLQEARTGLGLEKKKEVVSNLICQTSDQKQPRIPELLFKETGYEKEIEEYLYSARSYALNSAIQDYEQQLWKAYQRRTDEERDDREMRLREKKDSVVRQINRLLHKESLLQFFSRREPLNESSFNPVLPGGTRYCAAIVRAKEEIDDVDGRCEGTDYRVLFLHPNSSYDDGAPIKGIQLYIFNGTQDRMKDLL